MLTSIFRLPSLIRTIQSLFAKSFLYADRLLLSLIICLTLYQTVYSIRIQAPMLPFCERVVGVFSFAAFRFHSGDLYG